MRSWHLMKTLFNVFLDVSTTTTAAIIILSGSLPPIYLINLCGAALCSARIIKKAPDLAENFVGPATALLREKHHGVLITGVQLCTDLCKISSEALEHVRKKCTDGLVRVLKDLANNPYSPEYDVAGFTDPFLHIRLLRLLRVLGEGDPDASDSMNDILAQVATKIESNKTIGNAILYECVQTIMSIQDSGGLRVLAINILGKFLSHRDNNISVSAIAVDLITRLMGSPLKFHHQSISPMSTNRACVLLAGSVATTRGVMSNILYGHNQWCRS
ncbi:hypothetical protein V8G54_001427 [Vigna mungo]|uniref:Clathrin/coatomer adaptor adaptin-like N-terminal domain-containing protein n=1 Tax=Vigna mungo TaxID=3915 RepID=A0AAQ3PAF0_VIGMU